MANIDIRIPIQTSIKQRSKNVQKRRHLINNNYLTNRPLDNKGGHENYRFLKGEIYERSSSN